MRHRMGFTAVLALIGLIGSVGLSGCANSDDPLDVTFMAGTYNLTKITITPTGGATITLVPPYSEGTITLTASGTFSYSYIILGDGVSGAGTFTVDDPEIVFTELGDAPNGILSTVTHGIISRGGDTIIISETGSENSFTWEVTKRH